MRMRCDLFICGVLFVAAAQMDMAAGAGLPPHDVVYRSIMENYVKSTPVHNFLQVISVNTSFRLYQILSLTWQDEFLVWNATEHPTVWGLTFPVNDVWTPDVNIANSAIDVREQNWFRNVELFSLPDGTVTFVIRSDFSTTCSLDMTYFPYDVQMCNVDVSLQMYPSMRCNLTTGGLQEMLLEKFTKNGEWDLGKTRSKYAEYFLDGIPVPFSQVRFTIELKRKALYYMLNVLFPCVMLSLLTLLVFCMPPDAGEKVSLSITVLLSFTVFMLMVSDNMPQTSNHTPILAVYLICAMALSMFSLVATVAVLAVHHHDPSTQVPQWLRSCLRLPGRGKVSASHQGPPPPPTPSMTQDTLSLLEVTDLDFGIKDVDRKTGGPDRKLGDPDHMTLLFRILLELRRLNKTSAASTASNEWKEAAMRLDAAFFYGFLGITVLLNVILLVMYAAK